MQIDVTGKDCPWRDYVYLKPARKQVVLVKRPLEEVKGGDNADNYSLEFSGWYIGLMSPPGIQVLEYVDIDIAEEAIDFRPQMNVRLLFKIWLRCNDLTVADQHRQIGEVQYSYDPERVSRSEVTEHVRSYINHMLGIE